jgi:hypothetical protein
MYLRYWTWEADISLWHYRSMTSLILTAHTDATNQLTFLIRILGKLIQKQSESKCAVRKIIPFHSNFIEVMPHRGNPSLQHGFQYPASFLRNPRHKYVIHGFEFDEVFSSSSRSKGFPKIPFRQSQWIVRQPMQENADKGSPTNESSTFTAVWLKPRSNRYQLPTECMYENKFSDTL